MLGFSDRRTASRLMNAARKWDAAPHLDEAAALAISRQLWGHDDIDEEEDADTAEVVYLKRDAAGKYTPETQKALAPVVKALRAEKVEATKEHREIREAELGAKQIALPDQNFGVIYADPAWRFMVRSEACMLRSADNHYPTMTLEEIKAYGVQYIAAKDSVLFLWATAPMLPQALEVMAAWGFEYKTHFVWLKDRTGTGYWNLNQHELLLVGTKGGIPCPAAGTQYPSVIEPEPDPHRRHSEKPDEFRKMIEDYFPTLPKHECFYRGKEPPPGWDVSGNEAGKQVKP